MINKFQKFSGKRILKSPSETFLLLAYDSHTTNRLPVFVCLDGVYYRYQTSFLDSDLLALYSPTSHSLKSLLDFSVESNSNLFIEYINGFSF